MFKKSLMIAFLMMGSLVLCESKVYAAELDLGKIKETMAENKSMDTEVKAAKMLIAYADLMTYLSEIVASQETSLQGLLPEVEAHLAATANNSDADVQTAIEMLKGKVAELSTAVSTTSQGIQNMAPQVSAMTKLNSKYPHAKFTAVVTSLISLTNELASNHATYSQDLISYLNMLSGNEKTSKKVKNLGQKREKIMKYSFQDIAQRFSSFSTVLKVWYAE